MQKAYMLLIFFGATVIEASKYTCSTPNDRFRGDHKISLWPSGNVPYHLNSSLIRKDTAVIYEAFKEYHSKTCVRFVPKQDTDTIFTSIENNNDVCGSATVCMREGYQHARFGRNCKTKQIMIHELGHNLCLTHEQRSDRDVFLYTCANSSPEKDSTTPNRYFYDYASQMHSECSDGCLTPKKGDMKVCGPQVTGGLSLLDVDYIKELYSCGGCFRHRWVPVEKFTKDMEKDLPDFGRKFDENATVFPCRSYIHKDKELSVGTFWLDLKICYIPRGREIKLEGKDFEILTIPGGIRDFQSEYSLTEVTNKMTEPEIDEVVADAVPAISFPWSQVLSHEFGYVTYGNVDARHHCVWGEGEVGLIGKAIHYENNFSLHFPVCYLEVGVSKADILVCKTKMPKLYPADALINDPFKYWKLRHMEPIDSSYTETRVSIIGKIFSHSTDIYLVVSEQVSAGPILLYLHFHFNSTLILKINSLSKDLGWNTETGFEIGNEIWLSTENAFKIDIIRENNEFQVIVNSFLVARHTYIGDVGEGSTHFLRCYGDAKIDSVDIYFDGQTFVETRDHTSQKIASSRLSTQIKDTIGLKEKLQSSGRNTFIKTSMYVLFSALIVSVIVGVVVLFKHRNIIREKYMEMPLIFERL